MGETITYGYARVSSASQKLDIQIKRLIEAGIDKTKIYTDKKSGKNNDRDGLNNLINKIKTLKSVEDDTGKKDIHIKITKMDRLGRSTLDMLSLIKQFKEDGVTIHFIDENLVTGTSHSDMVMTILSAVAESERIRILERTAEGRKEAMARGKKFGAPLQIDREKVIKLHQDGMGVTKICKELGIKSRSSVYRILREEEVID